MPFNIIIKPTSQLTPLEHARVDEVDHLAFHNPAPKEDTGASSENEIIWASSDYHLLGVLDDSIVCLIALFIRDVHVGEQGIRLAGVGGVATHPLYQRRGFAGLLLQQAEIFIRDQLKIPFSLLVCSLEREAYYQKFGWKTVTSPMVFDTPNGKRTWDEVTMILPIAGEPWPSGAIDLCGLPW